MCWCKNLRITSLHLEATSIILYYIEVKVTSKLFKNNQGGSYGTMFLDIRITVTSTDYYFHNIVSLNNNNLDKKLSNFLNDMLSEFLRGITMAL